MINAGPSAVDRAIERWRAELLDLSKANRLLYFKPGRGSLTLTHPSPSELFDGLANHGRSFTFTLPDDEPTFSADEQLSLFLASDSSDGDEEEGLSSGILPRPLRPDQVLAKGEHKKIESTLYRLRLKSRSVLLEQGINVLFVAFGLLDWSESPHSDLRMLSPLVLVPVQLERRSTLEPYKLGPLDDNPVFNPALALKMERDFGLKLELPGNDETDLTLDDLLSHIRLLIAQLPQWSVRSAAHLGLFSFAKHAMYADLATNKDRLSSHPIVRLIGGEEEGLPEPPPFLPTASFLDAHVKPQDVFQVLDADASQQEAIAHVKAGASLVIQGPPGTGKSQTITNIIAECLAQQKTVLFVSEKMAALRVVGSRLAQVGLGEFCLEAHGGGAKKESVVKALANTLMAERREVNDGSTVRLEHLSTLRHALSEYVRVLHDAHTPLGLSAFQVHREIGLKSDAPVVVFALPEIDSLTLERLERLIMVVKRLASVGQVLLTQSEHPWFGASLGEHSPETQSVLDDQFHQIAAAADGLAAIQAALREELGLPPLSSIESTEWLANLLLLLEQQGIILAAWLAVPSTTLLIAKADEWHTRTLDYQRRRAALLKLYKPTLFGIDLPALLSALDTEGVPHATHVRGIGNAADRALARRGEIRAAVTEAIGAFRTLLTAGAVAPAVGMIAPRTLEEARRTQTVCELALTDPRPQADWFRAERRVALEEMAANARHRQEAIAKGRATLLERFEDELLATSTVEIAQRFDESYGSWHRLFKPRYHRDMRQLRRLLRDGSDGRHLSHVDAWESVRLARRVQVEQTRLDEQRVQLMEAFGPHFVGARTDWDSVVGALATVRSLCEVWGGREPPPALVALLTGSAEGLESLRPRAKMLGSAVSQVESALGRIMSLVTLDGLSFGAFLSEDMPLAALGSWLAEWVGQLRPLWSAADALDAERGLALSSVAAAVSEVREALSLRAFEQDSESCAAELTEQFGRMYRGLETDWSAIMTALHCTDELLAHFQGAPPATFIEAFASSRAVSQTDKDQLSQAIELLVGLLENLSTLVGAGFCAGRSQFQSVDLHEVALWARAKRIALPRLEEWVTFRRVVAEAEAEGLAGFVAGVQRDRPQPEHWVDAFVRQTYATWLVWRYQQAPALARFQGEQHQQLIEEFRQLDQLQCRVASRRIAQVLIPKRPRLGTSSAPRSEPAKLMREAGRHRFRPLRQLFAEIPSLLPALKPCILMSPLSVAQYLGESAITFDVVIFDEASQIIPADAIGAIGRGQQVVVVGDQMQLPPTRFFAVDAQISDDGAGDEEPPESILDACVAAGLPPKHLLWHYRSRHEHLIAFSNRAFYEGRLITFPSADESTRALEFVLVDEGVYDRGASKVNRAEARRMADLVINHILDHPTKSIGVITFSEAQMVAVQTELDVRKRANPELDTLLHEDGPQGFFVKNLENVQGDERDVIFFSVGYGPDQTGNMSMNFGPLNKQGGERRLNVAITRAREHVTILASFLPHRIDLARTQSRGVILLRHYLDFALNGPAALLGQVTSEGGEPDSTFEELVANALVAHGLNVVTQVGVGPYRIDLAIKDQTSGQYLVGIECDGAMYHSAQTARERDRLRQQVLEGLGWRMHRVWSTDWIKNPRRETEKILSALDRALADIEAGRSTTRMVRDQPEDSDGRLRAAQAPEQDTVERQSRLQPSPTVDERPIAQPYQRVQLGNNGDLEHFREIPLSHLAALMRKCVDVEGPVHLERVMEAVAESFGIKRVGSRVRARLLSLLPLGGGVRCSGDFLWSKSMKEAPVRALDAEGKVRPIDKVAPEELAASVSAFLTVHFAIDREGLVAGVAHAMGYRRTGPLVESAIDQVISGMLHDKLLVNVGGQLRRRT